jgi:hypothetical protein
MEMKEGWRMTEEGTRACSIRASWIVSLKICLARTRECGLIQNKGLCRCNQGKTLYMRSFQDPIMDVLNRDRREKGTKRRRVKSPWKSHMKMEWKRRCPQTPHSHLKLERQGRILPRVLRRPAALLSYNLGLWAPELVEYICAKFA